jgi:hypothetical protein
MSDELIQLQYKQEFLLLPKKNFPQVVTCSITKSCDSTKGSVGTGDWFTRGKTDRA